MPYMSRKAEMTLKPAKKIDPAQRVLRRKINGLEQPKLLELNAYTGTALCTRAAQIPT